MQSVNSLKRLYSALLLSLLSGVAYAHHPNGSKTPDSLIEGLLSGFGHPVIGLDHLVFVVAIGLLGYLMKQRINVALWFIGGTVLGTIVHLAKVNMPLSEVLIAMSVVLVGIALLYKPERYLSPMWYLGLMIAGTLHGYAYGESIIGAEATPLAAYLAGFTFVQLSIALMAAFFCQWLDSSRNITATNFAKFYGAIAVCVGTFFLV